MWTRSADHCDDDDDDDDYNKIMMLFAQDKEKLN